MNKETMTRVVITGRGVINSVSTNVYDFSECLKTGKSGVEKLSQFKDESINVKIGAEIKNFIYTDYLNKIKNLIPEAVIKSKKILKNNTYSTRISTCAMLEAYIDAGLINSETSRNNVGVIVSGNNINQNFIIENYTKFSQDGAYINPKYAISFFDTNLVSTISEIIGIHGIGYTVGGASASGNIGLFNAYQLVRNNNLDVCLCIGAMADLSELELHAFSILGAICTDKYNDEPEKASRPFDINHAGFVFGQGAGCLVLENLESAEKRGARIYGEITGASIVLDGNHLSNPDMNGEIKVMQKALKDACIQPGDIDYINAHGTSSPLGDKVEAEAIKQIFKNDLDKIYVNSSKSLIGHCLYSAGIIELISLLLQMEEGFCHPNLNLVDPIDCDINFVGDKKIDNVKINYALSNSFGFGGINSSIIVKNY